MDQKEKMKELIKKKQGGGRSKQMETPKNDRKNMRKGPSFFSSLYPRSCHRSSNQSSQRYLATVPSTRI